MIENEVIHDIPIETTDTDTVVVVDNTILELKESDNDI